jgi:excisionase family DNA binding protein
VTRFLTTNQIAQLVGVSERTVANWVDRGHLDAFRTPGGHRRIKPDALRVFLQDRGLEVPRALRAGGSVLIFTEDVGLAINARSALNGPTSPFEVSVVQDAILALLQIGERKPGVVVIDSLARTIDGRVVTQRIKAHPDYADVRVVLLAGGDPVALRRETGADLVLSRQVPTATLRQVVERLLGLATPTGPLTGER